MDKIDILWKRLKRQGKYYDKPIKYTEFREEIENLTKKAEVRALTKIKSKAGWYHELSHTNKEDTLIPISEIDKQLAELQESEGEG